MATLRRLLVLLLLLGLVLVSGSPLAPPVGAQTVSDAPVRLPGHTLAALPKATKVARAAQAAAADPPLTLTVVLNRTDESGFARFLADVEDPHSANHGKFISQAEVTKRFGPSQQAYDGTLAFLQQQGFVLVEGSANRLTLTVKGTRGQAEKAFGVQIAEYQLGKRSFYANDQDPAVPGSIAKNIQAVAGLSNLAQPQPNTTAIRGLRECKPPKDFPPDQIANLNLACGGLLRVVALLYFIGCGASNIIGLFVGFCNPFTPVSSTAVGAGQKLAAGPGVGQKIGLLEYDTFNPADVSAYLNLIGYPATQISQLSKVAVNGGVASPGPGETETLLDIDTVMSGAPGANVVVYDAPGTTSFQTMFNAMVNDGDTVISNSWSYCEDQTSLADVQSIDAIFANASASGVSIFNASGDSGSACLDGSPNTVGVPADAPHATAVGGTTANLGPGATYGGETWWDGSHATPPTGQGGFGVSRFFSRPAYQDGLTSAANRSVPDVVANADPASGITLCQADAGGCPDGLLHGGTSLAAPEWAVFGALLNQQQGHHLGNLNPLLYPRANTTAFHTPASMGSDFAHVGLGSPRLDTLNVALGGLTIGPVDGAQSVVAAFSSVAADGNSPATIRVVLIDANGHYVTGKNVSLAASAGSHATLSAASGPSSVDNATVLFTAKDSTIEDVTFTATDTTDGVPIQTTATVHFVSPPATTAGIAASPTTVAANGTAFSTITVTLHDANGQGTSGKTVTLSQGSGHSHVVGPTPATTDASGQVTFKATDTITETVVYTAVDVTDGNLPVPGSASVSFTSGNLSCESGTPTAAPGYAFTPFATGFIPSPTCGGAPLGLTFDASGNLLVVNAVTSFLYKFGPQGGIADATTQVNTTAIPGNLRGLVFGKDGKLYLARISANDIVEINPTNGTIVRIVVSGLNQPIGMVVDPLSGDLFANQAVGSNTLRIANPASATPTVTVYAAPGFSDGLTVAPDGTFFSALLLTSDIVRIAGTNTPQPAAFTTVTNVPQVDGIAVAATAGVPTFLFANRNNGTITKVDLTTTPPTKSDIFTGGSRGDFATVGPDGCFYGTQADRVIKVTNADGSCPFAPTNVQPQIGLSPSTVTPNPPTGSPVTFTATLRNVPSPVGATVTFTVSGANPQTKLVPADANGVATFTYTGAFTGADTITATAKPGATTLTSNPATLTWAAGKDVTFVSLNLSATSGAPNAPKTLTASLTDVSHTPPTPIGGAALTIAIGGQTCTATTGNDGVGSCSITPTVAPGSYALVATYAGNAQYTASTATTSFSVSGLVSGLLQFYPLAKPVRLLDTRVGATAFVHPDAALTAGQTLALPGQFSYQGVAIPPTAQAIVGNATVANGANATPAGFATLFPSGVPLPLASNLNFVPGTVRPNAFTVALGSDTKFNLYSSSGGDFVVDVSGYYAPIGAGGLYFHPLSAPVRELDTRAGATAFLTPGATLTAGQTLTLPGSFSFSGIAVPVSAKALVGNATVANNANGTPAGFATLFPDDVPLPLASNLNFVPGTVAPNAFTVALGGGDGGYNLYSSTGGDFVIDITGYLDTVAAGGLLFTPLSAPVRELDTRAGTAAFVTPNATLTAGQTLTLPGSFSFSGITVPVSAKALVGNATVANNANTTPAGFATLYPDGVALPLASNLNFVPGQVAPNALVVGVGGDGKYTLYTSSGGDFVVDITGYFS